MGEGQRHGLVRAVSLSAAEVRLVLGAAREQREDEGEGENHSNLHSLADLLQLCHTIDRTDARPCRDAGRTERDTRLLHGQVVSIDTLRGEGRGGAHLVDVVASGSAQCSP